MRPVDCASQPATLDQGLVVASHGRHVVVETPDAVLVADRRHSQDVKHIVGELQRSGRSEHTLHRQVHHRTVGTAGHHHAQLAKDARFRSFVVTLGGDLVFQHLLPGGRRLGHETDGMAGSGSAATAHGDQPGRRRHSPRLDGHRGLFAGKRLFGLDHHAVQVTHAGHPQERGEVGHLAPVREDLVVELGDLATSNDLAFPVV